MTREFTFLRQLGKVQGSDRALEAAWNLREESLRKASARLRVELAALDQWAQTQGVQFLLLKGAALMLCEYGNTLARPLTDIDVLVRPDEAPRIIEALKARSYQEVIPKNRNRWQQEILEEIAAEGRVGLSRTGLVPLDIHWKLSYWVDSRRVELDTQAFWATARPLAEGSALFLPDPDLHFTLMLVHAHEYRRPTATQLLDLAVTYRRLASEWGQGLRQEDRAYLQKKVAATLQSLENLWTTGRLDTHAKTIVEEKNRRTSTFWQNIRRGRLRSPHQLFWFTLGYVVPNPAYYVGSPLFTMYGKHYLGRFLPGWAVGKAAAASWRGKPATFPDGPWK